MKIQLALGSFWILAFASLLVVQADNVRRRRRSRRLSAKGSLGKSGGRRGHCETKRPRRHGRDDLGIRFNKFQMLDHYDGRPIHLDWRDFPMRDRLAYKLAHYSNIQSVMTYDDYELHGACIEDYIHEVGGYPSFPSRDPGSHFWKELQEVVDAYKLRLRGKIPPFFVLPDLWYGWTADEVAEAVHDEASDLEFEAASSDVDFYCAKLTHHSYAIM